MLLWRWRIKFPKGIRLQPTSIWIGETLKFSNRSGVRALKRRTRRAPLATTS
jgi:hypothetical protein